MRNQYLLRDYHNIHSVCEKAIFTYGAESQKIKAVEEIGELIEALSTSLLSREHNVEEEMADVFIMLCQLKKMYQVKSEDTTAFRPLPTGLTDLIIAMNILSKLSQAISRQLLGNEHDVENQIINAENILITIMDRFDADTVDRFIYKKLERLAQHIW